MFSSLTPHATGHNTTDEVRKAYILQYAPDGAVALEGDPDDGAPTDRVIQTIPAASSRSWRTENRWHPATGTEPRLIAPLA